MAKFNVNETLEMESRWNLTGSKKDELNQKAFFWNLLYNTHLDYLINICSNLFTWEGLPISPFGEEIRSSFLESMLSVNGTCAFSETVEYGLIITPCTVVPPLNIWGEPNELRLTAQYDSLNSVYGGIPINLTVRRGIENGKVTGDKFVLVRNDNTCTGFFPLIQQTADMLTNCFMSSYVNINSQKFPIVIKGTKDTKMSMEIVANKIDSWEQYIFVKDNGSFDDKKVDVLNKTMPFVADKIYQSYQDILNNFFMRIGINMIPNAKKERMLKDEVNANNQAVQSAGDIFLNNRLEACDRINKMFGMSVSVRRNTDFIDSLNVENSKDEGKEVQENE